MTESKIIPFTEIAQRLDNAGVVWAVFAGTAAFVYGSSRPPTDMDILVPAAEGERMEALFPDAQVSQGQHGATYVIQLPGADIVAGLGSMDLDEAMAARLTRHDLAGASVPVIPPEDNILLKGLMGRGPEVGKHDWEDVQEMMAHLPTLDWGYLCWRAGTCGDPERVQPVLERLEMMWRQMGKAD